MSNTKVFTTTQEQRDYEVNEAFKKFEAVLNKYGYTIEFINIIEKEVANDKMEIQTEW